MSLLDTGSHFLICLVVQAVLSEQAQDLQMPNTAHATQTCHSLTFLFKSGTQIFLIILRLLLKSAAEASLARSACNNSKLELCRISSEAIFMLLAKTLRLFFFPNYQVKRVLQMSLELRRAVLLGQTRGPMSAVVCAMNSSWIQLYGGKRGVPNA